jgi:hypothetical protein
VSILSNPFALLDEGAMGVFILQTMVVYAVIGCGYLVYVWRTSGVGDVWEMAGPTFLAAFFGALFAWPFIYTILLLAVVYFVVIVPIVWSGWIVCRKVHAIWRWHQRTPSL